MTRLPKKYFKSITDYVKTYYTAYGAERADKLYDCVKTVTKDFTRTDPVYVRIGDDGEPEIHYTMSQADGSKYFAKMNLGNATLCVHVGKSVTSLMYAFTELIAKKVSVHNITSAVTSLHGMFQVSEPDEFSKKQFSIDFVDCDTSGVTNIIWLFRGRAHTNSVPLFDTSKATDCDAFAFRCDSLQEIPAYDLSNAKSLNNAFDAIYSVASFKAYGMKVSFNLSLSALKHDAILEVFNNLGSDVAEGTTLTLGSAKLALMSDEEKKIATDKGWTLA
jgi:hypothetical protein